MVDFEYIVYFLDFGIVANSQQYLLDRGYLLGREKILCWNLSKETGMIMMNFIQ